MVKKSVFASDLTGNDIPEKELAEVTIRFLGDDKREPVKLEVAVPEVKNMIEKGRTVKHRGRPKAKTPAGATK